jgi:hypothetical protein
MAVAAPVPVQHLPASPAASILAVNFWSFYI